MKMIISTIMYDINNNVMIKYDRNNLMMKCDVNGQVCQDGCVDDMYSFN